MKYKNLPQVQVGRRETATPPKKLFHIYCEGEKTEPNYLNAYIRSLGSVPYDIKVIAPVGVAKTVASEACEQKRKLERELSEGESLSTTDEFWIVFDCDEEETSYSEAIRRAKESNVKVACSNPCFELWLVIHFEDFNAPDGHRQLQKRVRSFCPEYHPTKNKTVNFTKLKDKVCSAEQRAVNLRIRRKDDGASRPETTFDQLTTALRQEAKPVKRGKPVELEGIKVFESSTRRHNKPGTKNR